MSKTLVDSSIQVGASYLHIKDYRKPRSFTADKIADRLPSDSDSDEYFEIGLDFCNDVGQHVNGYLLKCVRANLNNNSNPNSATHTIGTQTDDEDMLEAWDDYYEMKIDDFNNPKGQIEYASFESWNRHERSAIPKHVFSNKIDSWHAVVATAVVTRVLDIHTMIPTWLADYDDPDASFSASINPHKNDSNKVVLRVYLKEQLDEEEFNLIFNNRRGRPGKFAKGSTWYEGKKTVSRVMPKNNPAIRTENTLGELLFAFSGIDLHD